MDALILKQCYILCHLHIHITLQFTGKHLLFQVDISLSSIFQESLERDEGFFGVGEEHQSAALNVIAVLFGKKESSFKHLFNISDENENENLQMDIEEILCCGSDFLNSNPSKVLPALHCEERKQEQCSGGDYKDEQEELKRDVDELFESLVGCEACNQQQTIGASQGPSTMSSVTHGPLYKRRSVSRGSGGNTPIIPQSTENDIPDDRPPRSESADLDFNLHTAAPLSELHLMTPGDDLENSSTILNAAREANFVNSSFSETGSCLNSKQYDFDVFKSQTVPVVVVATGVDQSAPLSDCDVDPTTPKATFHWTLDDSNCHEDAGEESVSPLVIHPNHFGEVVEEPTLLPSQGVTTELRQSNSIPDFCFSFSQDHLEKSFSPYGPDDSHHGEALEKPRSPIGLHLHQYEREGSDQPYSPMGPRFQQYRQLMDQTESPITRQLDSLLNDALDHTRIPFRMGLLPVDEHASGEESQISPMMQRLQLTDAGQRGPSLSSDDGDAVEVTTGGFQKI